MRRFVVFILALAALPAQAQERTAAERQSLVGLSYVLGEAHALRSVCEGRSSQRWRERMTRLIELEQPDEGFKRRLLDSFNAGFAYREAAHPACDSDARAAVTETARRGQEIARSVVNASVAAAAATPPAAVR
jgi:uncharacterized protein (TIGR02301 family)